MKRALLYTFVFLAIQGLLPLLINTTLGLLGKGFDKQEALSLIIYTAASSVVTIALFLFLRWAKVSRGYVRSRPWAVLCWCSLAAAGCVIPSVWLQEQMPELPNLMEQEFDLILKNRWGYLVVGLLAPVCEELVFRGAILRALLRWRAAGHWLAIAISALLFALIHVNPAQMPHAFVVGLLLGWLYYRTDSVVPGIVYHWINNSIAYVFYNLYPDPSLHLVDLFGSQRSVAAAVMFSLFILLPSLYQLNMRLRKAA